MLSVALVLAIQLTYPGSSLWRSTASPSGWRIAAGLLVTLLQAAAGIAAGVAGRPISPRRSGQVGYWLLVLVLSAIVSVLTFGWTVMLVGVLALIVSPAFGLAVVGMAFLLRRKLMG